MNRKISVIGLGYVGLPVAVAFGQQHRVIGFDIQFDRIDKLGSGIDVTQEVAQADLLAANIEFTCEPTDLKRADFHIVAVPTPINAAKQPDLTPLIRASETIGSQLKPGDIVVYESTVYPGATEEDCVPVLEQCSGLTCGKDFFVGYSPERINPGDKTRTFTSITKIVSGQTPEVLDIVAEVYASVVTAGVYRASSIKVAEAAKVIENTQRDLNIALVNELAIIFNKMNIDTLEVLEAAGSKWNFLPFRPGIVGGHCIGVDPFYLTYKANLMGLHPEVILAGRRINDNMGRFIAQETIKQIIQLDGPVRRSTIAILGLTFKENCPDIRNSRVIDIHAELQTFNTTVLVHDPLADAQEVRLEYGINLVDMASIQGATAVIFAVAHEVYRALSVDEIVAMLGETKLVIDVKGMLDADALAKHGVTVWRL